MVWFSWSLTQIKWSELLQICVPCKMAMDGRTATTTIRTQQHIVHTTVWWPNPCQNDVYIVCINCSDRCICHLWRLTFISISQTRGKVQWRSFIYQIDMDTQSLVLMHWGRVTHICLVDLTSIASDNGLSPGRRQTIILTNAGILLFGSLERNFSAISIQILTFSFKIISLKVSSAKLRPFCRGRNAIIRHNKSRCLKELYMIRKSRKRCIIQILKWINTNSIPAFETMDYGNLFGLWLGGW